MLKKIVDKILGSKIFWMAFSLLSAFLLWLYVQYIGTSVIQLEFKDIPIEYVGEGTLDSRGIIVVESARVKTMAVTLSGPRNKLNRMTAEDIKITIDISNIGGAGTSYYTYAAGRIIIEYAETEISVSKISPTGIVVTTANSKSREIDFVGEFKGTLTDAFEYLAQEDAMEFKPGTLTVKGPVDIVDRIDHAYVELWGENVQKTLTAKCGYILVDADGNRMSKEGLSLSVDQVEVTMPVTMVKDVPVEVTVKEGGGANMDNCKILYNPQTVTITGDPDLINGIDKITLGTLDLSTIDAVYVHNYPLNVVDAEIISGQTSVEVTVNITGLVTEPREVLAENVRFSNLPEGFRAVVKSGNIAVSLRAPGDIIGSIRNENIYFVVDLTGLTAAGTYQMAVSSHSIMLQDGTKPQAGLVSAEGYKVVIALEKTG